MSIRAEDIRLVHRIVGRKHVITSPDVPELHVSHDDEQVAREHVQAALNMLESMEKRLKARRTVTERMRGRAVA